MPGSAPVPLTRAIQAIEAITGRPLVVLAALNPGDPLAGLDLPDADLLDDVLRALQLDPARDGLDVWLATPGGSATAAERLLHVMRTHAAAVRVLVGASAWSSGVLIALGADQLAMTESACLGGLDAQLAVSAPPPPRLVGALGILRAYAETRAEVRRAEAAGESLAGPTAILAAFGTLPFEAQQARSAIVSLALGLARRGLLRAEPARAERVVLALADEGVAGHGMPLYAADLTAEPYRLPVERIERGTPLEAALAALGAALRGGMSGISKTIATRHGRADVRVRPQSPAAAARG
jgi:hypothetical protein